MSNGKYSELNSHGNYGPEYVSGDTHTKPRQVEIEARIAALQLKAKLSQGEQVELELLLRCKWGA